uniref:uncharacterized protein LOC120811023 isoform X2 n=1 Tax=Gasterosteus aculeatus aculeatus TaxID=481459 RepID=UPI001A9A1740|nr:uncharacterized protein LOC120811023 isoform X2 [Gasterosteus aculeatus aculeatus]
MADGDKKVVCCVLLLLTGAVGQGPRVDYQHPLCAVKGSTLTILCSFTPQSVNTDGKQVLVEIIRVVWCKNHEICQLTTPSVYDSELQNKRVNNPRYRYLGDKKGNCSLQITGVQDGDNGTFRFRMEANDAANHYTGRSGATVRVSGGVQVSLIVSVVSSVLMLLCFVIVVLAIIRKKNQSAVRGEAGPEVKGAQQQEEDVSYAHIQFKARGGQARPVKVEDDSIIYSSVVA